jgi:acyl-homoserine-lactone acylase
MTTVSVFRAMAFVVALCTIAVAAALVVGFASADDERYSAEIRRTEYRIPHILASDYGSLGYGYGYAFAQDNLCVMADRVVTLRGERSRYFGPRADPNDPFADEEDASSNFASDVYYRVRHRASSGGCSPGRPRWARRLSYAGWSTGM